MASSIASGATPRPWPDWARRVVTVLVLLHAVAIFAGAWAFPPSSRLARRVADGFSAYHQWIDQGKAYRYYSSAFPPTAVVSATVSFRDGRADRVVRLPERGTWPRLRYQRQLALAHHLTEAFHGDRDGAGMMLARAYATHLERTNPGCSEVKLQTQMHLVPTIERVDQGRALFGPGPVDIDADEFYTAPERIGVFPCAGS